MNQFIFGKFIIVCGLVLLFSACSTTSTSSERYFSLTPIQSAENDLTALSELSLGVGPVEIPRMLNRPQIVYRKNSNEVILSEQNQWAGSLREEIQDTLIEQIIQRTGSHKIIHYPWPSDMQPAFVSRIHIDRLDGELGKKVILEAHWDLIKRNSKELIATRKSHHSVSLTSDDFLSYVVAQQSALIILADEIVTELKKYQRENDL